MGEVTLLEMLSAREERVKAQSRLLKEYGCPIISFTMNIAGPQKTSPLIERAFDEGIKSLICSIPAEKIIKKEIFKLKTGCECYISADLPADELKKICVGIEEKNSLGRLFDMDVIDISGKKLERENERGCIICGKKGRGCAASRAHSVEELKSATYKIISEYFAAADSEIIAEKAVQSLVDEVLTTPKAGLVDRRNCGSHTDMNIDTFLKSAASLRGYFEKCVEIGQQTSNEPPEYTFPPLKDAGVEAEKQMLRATGGVNTHKGAIYSMGLVCGAIGRLYRPENPISKTEDILSECSRIVKDAAESDLNSASGKTSGERLYLERGIRGIRGEAADGFPSVLNVSLPAFCSALESGKTQNDAAVRSLLELIACVEDTNLYKRGGIEGARWAKNAARELLKKNPTNEQIEALDDEFIKRNLSPGGCADLLALTLFLHSLKNKNV